MRTLLKRILNERVDRWFPAHSEVRSKMNFPPIFDSAESKLPPLRNPIVPVGDRFRFHGGYRNAGKLRQRHAELPSLPLYLDLHFAQRIRRLVVVEHAGDHEVFTHLQRRIAPHPDALGLEWTRQLALEMAPPPRPHFMFVVTVGHDLYRETLFAFLVDFGCRHGRSSRRRAVGAGPARIQSGERASLGSSDLVEKAP